MSTNHSNLPLIAVKVYYMFSLNSDLLLYYQCIYVVSTSLVLINNVCTVLCICVHCMFNSIQFNCNVDTHPVVDSVHQAVCSSKLNCMQMFI
jgi:hypothetical protein